MLGQTAAQWKWYAVPSAAPAGCSPISAVAATAQAAETFCTNAVTTCGYADPMNQTAGVPAGTNLSTTGACATYANGGTISSGTVTINGCKITGHINVTGGTVTVENSDITASDTAQSIGGVMISCGSCSVTVKYDTIHGTAGGGSGGGPAGELEFGVYDKANSAAATIDHVYFYNGDRILMNYAYNTTPTITNSFCWGNASNAHAECVYTGPPANISIQSSTLIEWRSPSLGSNSGGNRPRSWTVTRAHAVRLRSTWRAASLLADRPVSPVAGKARNYLPPMRIRSSAIAFPVRCSRTAETMLHPERSIS